MSSKHGFAGERGPIPGDLRLDAVDVIADVHAIDHRLFVGVVLDQVPAEEADGLFRRGGGQADQEGVEVLEHLPPDVVDAAVTFIDDNEVEGLDRDEGVVDDRQRLFEQRVLGLKQRALLVLLEEVGFPLEHRVEPLDGGDADLGRRGEGVFLEVLDGVFVGELVPVDGADELLELVVGLLAEVVAVDEEEDPAGVGVLDEPVAEVDGGEGLATAGGHLDEGPGLVEGE